jgi:AcrR family transcriptional regulator
MFSVYRYTRHMRIDAERNRRRILEAASELFAEKGLAVGLDEIARHAGVGVGTCYRRFPQKEELIDALFEERLDRVVALAEQALAHDDPWEGLVGFLEGSIEMHVANRGLKELIFTDGRGQVRACEGRTRMAPLVEELVRRAKASGDLRPDVEPTDMPVLQFMISGVHDIVGPAAPDLWRRYLGIVLDGLRAPRPGELSCAALTPDAFEKSLSSG